MENELRVSLRSWIYINFGSIQAFANELGINQTNISRYLNGNRKPGHDFYKKIRRMGCDLNWLFGD
ncbi:MAG: helix-turn-helix transcriptional regulator [Bacteroidetes bacterium]|nr:helix-turn-helix transcriptional regulator [Bacteroidota bacterium]